MTRIFTTLSIITLALLGTSIFLGLSIGNYNAAFQRAAPEIDRIERELKQLQQQLRPNSAESRAEISRLGQQRADVLAQYAPFQKRFRYHFTCAVATALITVLVNSISVTYFVGTSRLITEVVDTYGMSSEFIQRGRGGKRAAFRWALAAMLTVVGIISLGAAANPGTIRAGTAAWVVPHYWGAILGTGLIAWALWVQSGKISAHHALLQEVLAEVRRIRQERGLEVED